MLGYILAYSFILSKSIPFPTKVIDASGCLEKISSRGSIPFSGIILPQQINEFFLQ